jgi:DNA primase
MSYETDLISKNHKITDYLAQRGINHVAYDNRKYKYRCPLPNHSNDKTPSFFVFENDDRQDFYCFGCKKSGRIIQIVAEIEQISIKSTIERLSQGLNIKIDDVIDSIVKDITTYVNTGDDDEKSESIFANSLFVSSQMYNFLRKVNFDAQELQIAEQVFKITDNLVFTENINDLDKLVKNLANKTKYRYDKYVDNKKQQEIKKIKDSQFKI